MQMVYQIIDSMMDSIEDCFGTMSVPAGKSMVRVMAICVASLVFSVLASILHLPVFISWEEALTACLMVGLLCLADGVNRGKIRGVIRGLKSREKREE